jgi:hypothetical protein
MLKKLIVAFGLALGAIGFGVAATVPNIPSSSQYSEPSQIIGTLNYLIAQLNSLLPGQVASIPVPFTTATTTIVPVLTYSNVILNVGQAMHVHAWGVNGGSASTNTITIAYGSGPTSLATVVTGTSAKWWVDCYLQNVGTVASPVVQMECHGAQATTLITTGETSDTSDVATTPMTLILQSTASVASQQTVQGAYFEYVR